MTPCRICEKRRPRRFCPGIGGDICPLCCGREREVTVACPLDCEYLREARLHERQRELPSEDIPHRDVEITEDFLSANASLIAFLSRNLSQATLDTQGAVDGDLREAVEAMIKTQRTLASGLVYTSRPQNPIAASIQQAVQESLEQFRAGVARETGVSSVRDRDVLGVLVFLARIGAAYDNGRRRGRAFLDFLRSSFPAEPSEQGPSFITP